MVLDGDDADVATDDDAKCTVDIITVAPHTDVIGDDAVLLMLLLMTSV